MSIEQIEAGQVHSESASSLSAVLRRTRRLDAATIDRRMSTVMITATLLVIPVLVLEAQPLGAPWHTFAVVGDWLIWLIFLVELAAIIVLAEDWRSWLRAYPLAPALIVLTPPFAPAGLQTLRLFRLLRLIRVARGAQLLSKLLTLDGLKFVIALAVFLVIGGGAIFAGVESHVGHHVSTWDGIWWALGTVTTEGSNVAVTTTAGRVIAIVLMLTGIGVFSIMTGAIAQHFLASRAQELSQGERAIMDRLDELAGHLHRIEMAQVADGSTQPRTSGRIPSGPRPPDTAFVAGGTDDTSNVVTESAVPVPGRISNRTEMTGGNDGSE
jgi:voltage-gated potassium channel